MISNPYSLNWDNFRYFIALADQSTLSGAARTLNVTHATMARRIGQLEEEVGTALFDQGPAGYHLTEKGQSICKMILEMREKVSCIQALLEKTEPEGLVRLAATPFLCEELVKRCLPDFCRRFPNIDLEVLPSNNTVSLARMEAHLSLRLNRPETGDLIIRRVATLDYRLYMSEKLDGDERTAPIVQFPDHLNHLPEQQWLATHFGERRIALRTDSLNLQKTAIEKGIGIGLLPIYAAHDVPALVQIAAGQELPSRDVWLTVRRPLADVLRIRLLSDYLAEFFKTQRERYQADRTVPGPEEDRDH